MPKLEPKIIQRELDQGQIWPVYWLYGGERMKARELLKRIRKATIGDAAQNGASIFGLAEESFDAASTSASAIADAAQSPSLGGGLRLLVIREAHALKDAEALSVLFGPRSTKDRLTSVCVFLSKDLDGRKKFSKQLLEHAAVVPCEDVAEQEREAWIQYLAKRRGLQIPQESVLQLVTLDPWSLDVIDQELEKFSLAAESGEGAAVLAGGTEIARGGEVFLEAFFHRRLREALQSAEAFADRPDEALPLLGLLAWNVRHLALVLGEAKSKLPKINPYALERLGRWAPHWKLGEVLELQAEVAQLDFELKQTPLLPLGIWAALAHRFCR